MCMYMYIYIYVYIYNNWCRFARGHVRSWWFNAVAVISVTLFQKVRSFSCVGSEEEN
jgi:hypothetical protein